MILSNKPTNINTPVKGTLTHRKASLPPEMTMNRNLQIDLSATATRNNFLLPAISPSPSMSGSMQGAIETFGNDDLSANLNINGQTKLFLRRLNNIKQKMEQDLDYVKISRSKASISGFKGGAALLKD
jgi:hypothetical protein